VQFNDYRLIFLWVFS